MPVSPSFSRPSWLTPTVLRTEVLAPCWSPGMNTDSERRHLRLAGTLNQ